MAKLNLGTKVENGGINANGKLTAAETNSIQVSVNAIYDALFTLGLLGLIKDSALPPVYFSGVSGTGTQNDPYIMNGSGGQASPEQWLKSLPGYSDIGDKILYINAGSFSWGAVPSGNLEKLDTPTLTIGAAAVDSFPLSWNVVINATSYVLQRDTQATFATAVTVYNGPLRLFTDSGLAANTVYYYRLQANAAGFAASNFATGNKTTLAAGNITPPSPSNAVIDDTADTFNWTNATGYANISSYEYTLDSGGTYTQATVKPLIIGNVAKAIGTVGVRVKADTGRNASGTLFNGVAFNTAAVKAAKPTNPVTNNTADTFDWTNVPGFDLPYQYEYTLDRGATYVACTEKPLYVGDYNKAVGTVGVRVKAATGVLVSDTLYNTVAFTGTDGLIPITTWLKTEDFNLSGNNLIGANLGGDVQRARSSAYIPSGAIGSVQFTGYGRIGLDGSPTENSYGIQMDYGTNINSANSKISGSVGSTYFLDRFLSVPGGVTPQLRLRVDATTVYYGTSIDNGATWVEGASDNKPRTGGDLYIKADGGFATEDSLLNILGSGVLINGGLT